MAAIYIDFHDPFVYIYLIRYDRPAVSVNHPTYTEVFSDTLANRNCFRYRDCQDVRVPTSPGCSL